MKRVQDVGSIVAEWLKANGYDGLAGDECGCAIEDLFACGEPHEDCVPAYKHPCPEDHSKCPSTDDCGVDDCEYVTYIMATHKPEVKG